MTFFSDRTIIHHGKSEKKGSEEQMGDLGEKLMEELNCEVAFEIPVFGGIPIYESVVVTWIIMAVIVLLCVCLVPLVGATNFSMIFSVKTENSISDI